MQKVLPCLAVKANMKLFIEVTSNTKRLDMMIALDKGRPR